LTAKKTENNDTICIDERKKNKRNIWGNAYDIEDFFPETRLCFQNSVKILLVSILLHILYLL